MAIPLANLLNLFFNTIVSWGENIIKVGTTYYLLTFDGYAAFLEKFTLFINSDIVSLYNSLIYLISYILAEYIFILRR